MAHSKRYPCNNCGRRTTYRRRDIAALMTATLEASRAAWQQGRQLDAVAIMEARLVRARHELMGLCPDCVDVQVRYDAHLRTNLPKLCVGCGGPRTATSIDAHGMCPEGRAP